MGAHDIPNGIDRKQYVESVLSEQLPAVLEQGYADSVDVFCEPGWFTLSDTEDICKESINGGLNVRLHVDEFVDGGGLDLAAELGARTADHALHSNNDARENASKAGTVQGSYQVHLTCSEMITGLLLSFVMKTIGLGALPVTLIRTVNHCRSRWLVQ